MVQVLLKVLTVPAMLEVRALLMPLEVLVALALLEVLALLVPLEVHAVSTADAMEKMWRRGYGAVLGGAEARWRWRNCWR